MKIGAAISAVIWFIVLGGTNVHADTLLAGLVARTPAAPNEAAMSALALEACMKLAGSLDRRGAKIAIDATRIEHLTTERLTLENQINAELDQLSHYDTEQMAAFQRRVAHNDDVERELRRDRPAQERDRKTYAESVAGFERNCSSRFRAGDLAAAKAKLGLK